MEKRVEIENIFGKFTIMELNGSFYVYGNIKAAEHEFKKINRRPPNKYGNFSGREKAGAAACKEIIKNNLLEV